MQPTMPANGEGKEGRRLSCMEHVCLECGHMVFNNSVRGQCPKCGGEMIHNWDEQLDYERELAESRGLAEDDDGDEED